MVVISKQPSKHTKLLTCNQINPSLISCLKPIVNIEYPRALTEYLFVFFVNARTPFMYPFNVETWGGGVVENLISFSFHRWWREKGNELWLMTYHLCVSIKTKQFDDQDFFQKNEIQPEYSCKFDFLWIIFREQIFSVFFKHLYTYISKGLESVNCTMKLD